MTTFFNILAQLEKNIYLLNIGSIEKNSKSWRGGIIIANVTYHPKLRRSEIIVKSGKRILLNKIMNGEDTVH